MAENEMIYFLYGYIYAQAEQIVKTYYPRPYDKQFRAEVQLMVKELIYSLVKENECEEEWSNNGRE